MTAVVNMLKNYQIDIVYDHLQMVVFADIISDKGNDLIPGAKAYSDPSAAIRKASTFSLEICAEYLSIEV